MNKCIELKVGNKTRMDISIVIVSWNTRDLLIACLESVFQHPPAAEFEVRVVDNGSTDGTQTILAQQFPKVKLIQNQENVGFARANNQAIKQCHSEFILLLNPDTEVKENALQILLDYMRQHTTVGAVGPKTLNPDGSFQTSAYPELTLFGELWRLLHLDTLKPIGVYRQIKWDDRLIRPVDNLLGACILLRVAALARVGLLDERFYMYTEEIDLCHRLKLDNWQIIWNPNAHIIHYGGQSTQQIATKMFLTLYQTKWMYFKKHHGTMTSIIYKSILLFVSVLRLIFLPISILNPTHRRGKLQMAYRYWALIKKIPTW